MCIILKNKENIHKKNKNKLKTYYDRLNYKQVLAKRP